MLHKPFFLVALAVGIMMASACTSRQAKLNGADNGKTIKVKVGDPIVVQLEGNPSTGYTWEARDLDASMVQQVGDAEFKSINPGLIGSGGSLTLTFKTLKAGKTTLTLVYHRPWETGVKPLSTFIVSFEVK